MFRFVTISAAALALTVGSAAAADLPYRKAPPVMAPPPLAFSWTGAYVGAYIGANFASTRTTIPLYPSKFDVTSTGFEGGAKVGYNYEFPSNIVIGVEGSFGALTNSGSHATGLPGEVFKVESDWQGAAVGKLGYAFDRFMVYAKGGVAFADLNKLEYIPSAGTTSQSKTDVGWTAGAGIDYALTNQWILGADYAYAQYGKNNLTFNGPTTVKHSTSSGHVSLSYKFW